MTYIVGGTAPGGMRAQLGCKDRSLPVRDEAIEIPNGLYFGGVTPVWGGSPAFITVEPGQKPTKARAYLITVEQFWQIVQDENHLSHPVKAHDLSDIHEKGSVALNDVQSEISLYKRVVYCGERDGYPMLSFTSVEQHTETSPPTPIYLQTMAIGLVQCHHMSLDETVAYLADIPGIAGNYTIDGLKEAIEEVEIGQLAIDETNKNA